MPSTHEYRTELVLHLLCGKTRAKWKKKTVVLKRHARNPKLQLHIYHHFKPKSFLKFCPVNTTTIEISLHSHAVIKEPSENPKLCSLSLLQLEPSKEKFCYTFAAYTDQELDDLNKLGDAVQELCDVISYDVAIEEAKTLATGPAFLHTFPNTAILSTRDLSLHEKWELDSLIQFKLDRQSIHIYNVEDKRYGAYLWCSSPENARKIARRLESCSTSTCLLEQNPCYETTKCFQRNESYLDNVDIVGNNNLSPATPTSSTSTFSLPPSPHRCITQPELERELQIETHLQHGKNNLNLNESNLKSQRSMPSDATDNFKFPLKETRSNPVSSPKRMQYSRNPVKENVTIRYPGKERTRSHSASETVLSGITQQDQDVLQKRAWSLDRGLQTQQFRKEVKHEDKQKMEIENERENNTVALQASESTDVPIAAEIPLIQDLPVTEKAFTKELESLYENFRPTFYIYTNLSNPDEAPETPNTYVNIFSGNSFKGCYENWQYNSGVYSTIDVPPPRPRPRTPPPKLPPKRKFISHKEEYPPKISTRNGVVPEAPQRPPKRPPKISKALHCHNVEEDMKQEGTRIHVALFASTPVSGRVWFLRVAFMHQDEKDTTFKRVTDIERASTSGHQLLKSQSVEVSSDINVTLKSLTKGFKLLNGHQQDVDLLDINSLRKGDWFVIEFHVQHSDESIAQLTGNVTIEPNTKHCRLRCKAVMGFNEVFQAKNNNNNNNNLSSCKLKRSLLQDYNKRHNLCRALGISSQNRDWRQVAGSLGFTHMEILELQDKAHRSVDFSPMDVVLQIWEERDPNCSLERLVNILREIGRLDVVQDLGFSITLEHEA